jgi:hypothetical protein
MGRHIKVRAIRKEEPDIRLYVLALIALARQLQEEERAAAEQPATKPAEPEEGVSQ